MITPEGLIITQKNPFSRSKSSFGSDSTVSLSNVEKGQQSRTLRRTSTLGVSSDFSDKYLSGWRIGALCCAGWATVVLLINLACTIVGFIKFPYQGNGTSLLYTGDCDRTKQISTILHIAINVMSTILLGGSNYCMQILSAPTRKEVDRRHKDGKWLDIGVHSVRNIFGISRKRMFCWLMLGATSIPLHLMYNSVVFHSITTYEYDVMGMHEPQVPGLLENGTLPKILGDELFFDRAVKIISNCTETEMFLEDSGKYCQREVLSEKYPYSSFSACKPHAFAKKMEERTFKRLDRQECINKYSQEFITDHRNLLLVIDSSYNFSRYRERQEFTMETAAIMTASKFWLSDLTLGYEVPSLSAYLGQGNFHGGCRHVGTGIRVEVDPINASHSKYWWCHAAGLEDHCSGEEITDTHLESYPNTVWAHVNYCYAEEVDELCRLELSMTILIIVAVCNALKVLGMLATVFTLRDDHLVTLGDAIASFLLKPAKEIPEYRKTFGHRIRPYGESSEKTLYRELLTGGARWYESGGLKRMIGMFFFWVASIITAGVLFHHCIEWIMSRRVLSGYPSLSYLWGIGFGEVDETSVVGTDLYGDKEKGIMYMILLANIPQVVVSIGYLLFNGFFTTMFLGWEHSRLVQQRAGLRTSFPRGAQRSTFYLQLPYRYSMPLMISSALLHWLVSQSFFLVKINTANDNRISTLNLGCGFSAIAIVFSITTACIMLVGASVLAFRRYPRGIPLAGSCSAALAAACKEAPSEGRDPEKEVMWGVPIGGNGKCAITSAEVRKGTCGGIGELDARSKVRNHEGDDVVMVKRKNTIEEFKQKRHQVIKVLMKLEELATGWYGPITKKIKQKTSTVVKKLKKTKDRWRAGVGIPLHGSVGSADARGGR